MIFAAAASTASSWPALAAASDTAAYALDALSGSVIFAAAASTASSWPALAAASDTAAYALDALSGSVIFAAAASAASSRPTLTSAASHSCTARATSDSDGELTISNGARRMTYSTW